MSMPFITVPLSPGQSYPADQILVCSKFDQRVLKGDGCWQWQGSFDGVGYGRWSIKGHWHGAHRVSYQFVYGPLARKLFVCHACDNPRCVRPDHLFAGTAAANNADMWAKGRGVVNRVSLPGELNPQAELTEPEVRMIRRLVKFGIPQAVVAKAAGISFQYVSHIVHGKRWRHIV